MLKKKELKEEYELLCTKYYWGALERVCAAARFRRIDVLREAVEELMQLRHDISTLEWVLGIESDKCFLPHNGNLGDGYTGSYDSEYKGFPVK